MSGDAHVSLRSAGKGHSTFRALLAFSKKRLLLCVGAAVLMAALSTLSMYSRIALYGIGPQRPSAGDAILWLFQGNALGFSVEWGAVWCLLLVAAGVDVNAVLAGGGIRYAVACGDRKAVWRSICLACAVSAVAALVALIVAMAAFAVVLGGGATLAPTCIDEVSLDAIRAEATTADVVVFVALLASGAVAFAILQAALSLWAGQAAALASCVAILLGSAFLPMAPLPGSWLMATRLDCFARSTTVTTAWAPVLGLCLFAAVAALSLVLGGRAFDRLEFGITAPRMPRRGMRWQVARRFSPPLRYCSHVALRPLCVAVLLAALVSVAQCIDLLGRVALYAPAGSCPGLADYLAYALLGSRQPDPLGTAVSAARFITVPFGWLVLVLLPQVWTFLFATSMRYREVPEVLCGSRPTMWGSSCLVMAGGAGLICLVEAAVCLAVTTCVGGSLTGTPSARFVDVAGLPRETLPSSFEGLPVFVIAYCAISVGLSLAQLSLSEFIGPMLSLVAVAATLAAPVFLMSPVLFGNYLMCARSTVFVVSWQVEVQGGALRAGLDPVFGVWLAAALSVASIILGLWRAKTIEFYGGAGR